MAMKVLIIGAAGTVGGILRDELADDFNLTPADALWPDGDEGRLALDAARDFEGVKLAAATQDAIIHLGFSTDYETSCVNEMMAKNVFRAALTVEPHPRVIVASSIHAVGGHTGMLDVDAPLCPNGLYGAMKGYLELMGQGYARLGLQVVALRLGGVRADDCMADELGYEKFWLSRRDCAQLFRRALMARALPGFSVFYGISNNRGRRHDLSAAKNILAYAPMDDAHESR